MPLAKARQVRHTANMIDHKHPLNAADTHADLAAPPKPNMLLEYGPIFLFFALYVGLRKFGPAPENAIFPAAGIFAVTAVLAMIASKIKHGTIPKVLLMTTVIIVISVGLAFFTGDPIFIYMKPTVVNGLFGFAAIIGALIGKNPIKMLMGAGYNMSDASWKIMAIRWGLFFFTMAGVNEYVWRNYSEPTWVTFKAFGFLALTLVFVVSQMPFILKHSDIAQKHEE